MNRLTAGLFVLALGCSSAARADFRDRPVFDVHSKRSPETDTRIPIRGPVVISQSGDYVVANNFAQAPGAPAIQFLNPENIVVTIDLNGHTITASDQAILIHPRYVPTVMCVDLTLFNGTIKGAVTALGASGDCGNQLKINDVTLDHSGVYVVDGVLRVTSSRLQSSGLSTYGDFGAPRVEIVGNHFASSGIDVTGDGVIWRNTGSVGIVIGRQDYMGTSGYSVVDNDITGGISIGVDPFAFTSYGNYVARNHVHSIMLWNTERTVVEGNVIHGCTPAFSWPPTDFEIAGVSPDHPAAS